MNRSCLTGPVGTVRVWEDGYTVPRDLYLVHGEGVSMRDRVADYIRAYYRAPRYGPVYREIMDAVGISSTNGVVYHLKNLERDGRILWVKGSARALMPREVE